MRTVRELLTGVYQKKQESFFYELEQRLLQKKKTFVITANPEIVMKAREDQNLYDILMNKEHMITADGIGIVKAYKMLYSREVDRIAGVDIVKQLFHFANKHHKSLCILGSKQEVLDALKVRLCEQYPDLVLSSAIHGYVQDKDESMASFVHENPDIVLVALGVPAQEKLIYQHLNLFDHGIFVGIGGSLDVLSGTKKRAPQFFVKSNLEWLYRICSEPKRLKRFYESNIKFINVVRKER